MATGIEIDYEKRLEVKRSADSVIDYIADCEVSIPELFAGLESFQPTGDNTYRWKFKKIEQGGQVIQIEAHTRFIREGNRLRVESISGSENGQLKGEWVVTPKGTGCEIHFHIHFNLLLNVPFFLKGLVQSFALPSLRKFFDQYVDSLKSHFS